MRNDLASRLGIPVESIDFRIPELQLLFEGQIKEDSFWNSLLRERGWELEPLELKRMVRLNFREIEGTREVVCALRTLGYRIGLLSVHAQEWIEFCEEKFQYKDLFDVTMYSFEIAVCKPDKRAFEILLERLDLPAPRVLFIDDSLLNIEAANEMGIQVILFESATQLEAQLRDMGILL
jgi:FMN phosphatase YigB (HAD superfamily)